MYDVADWILMMGSLSLLLFLSLFDGSVRRCHVAKARYMKRKPQSLSSFSTVGCVCCSVADDDEVALLLQLLEEMATKLPSSFCNDFKVCRMAGLCRRDKSFPKVRSVQIAT